MLKKSRIFKKLFLYFTIALIIFSMIITTLFLVLYRKSIVKTHRNEMEELSQNIAASFASGLGRGGHMAGGVSNYLSMLRESTSIDVWVVDENLELITGRGRGMMQKNIMYTDFPDGTKDLVQEVFNGRTEFSESFSTLLNEPTLTIGTPINSGGVVVGAVLVHSPINGLKEANNQGITIFFISLSISLLLSFILASYFSNRFTKPLNTMNSNALKTAEGDYRALNNIKQDDEIGELANTLDTLTKRLEIANKESEKLDKLRREFVANVSHELKTPVTVIRGSLEALKEGVITDKTQIEEYYKTMLNESVYLQRLVNDLLDLSKLQNYDFAIEMDEMYISELVEDAIRTARNIAKEKNIEVAHKFDDPSFKIIGDYGRLRQMIMIVIDNAIKFSKPNSKILVELKEKKLYIKDFGAGIKKEDIPYIFDRFYMSRSEQNKKGTGLGLAIAKQIADRHGISLKVISEENKGAEFIFTFT